MIILINSIVEKFKNKMANFLNIVRHRRKFPNSKISLSSKLYDVDLSGYNVLFEKVILITTCVGEHTYIQRGSSVINAKIGKFCSIAPNVSIGPGIHKIESVSTHPSFFLKDTPLVKVFSKSNQFNSSIKTVIGNDVWIGYGAIILDGVKIEDGAVIAAGSVVTKDVSPYSVVAGVPAKHIKFRFNQDVINILQESEWWNFSLDWLENNYDSMSEINIFLELIKIKK